MPARSRVNPAVQERLDQMRHKALGVCAVTVIIGLAWPTSWQLATVKAVAQGVTGGGTGSGVVRAAPAGQRFGGKPGVRGATYYAFEGQAVRVTTEFGDATVVATRSVDGDVETTIRDRAGRETGKFTVDTIDATTNVLRYVPADGAAIQAFGEPSVHPTLDWANRQAYSLSRDRPAGVEALEWRGDVMRRRGAPQDTSASDPKATETEWGNGMSARSERRSSRPHQFAGHAVGGEVLVTHLRHNGTDLGTLNWYPDGQIFAWDLPGLTSGFIAPEHLQTISQGWPFIPDMTWLNIQAFAFHHYKTLIQRQGFVARNEPGWPARLMQFFAPTLRANEEGCDDLHWLDGEVLRFCCDVHDFCYEKNGCSSRSWWQFWSNWSCSACNTWVIVCFASGAGTISQIGMQK